MEIWQISMIVLGVIGIIGLYLNETDEYHTYWKQEDSTTKTDGE